MIDTNYIKDKNKNAAIIMRHADRNPIVSGVNDFEPLNEIGITNSVEFGKELTHFDRIKIFSSPVCRCIETGEAILRGARKTGTVITSDLLGEPGPFVFDQDAAGKFFAEIGTASVVMNQIAGISMSGIRPLADGCELLKNFITRELDANVNGNLLIFVTHDAIVAPFIYKYTGEAFGKENWIGFSDGAIIIKEYANLQMIRNGKTYEMC